MTWLWGVVAAGALLWPDRVSGPFDGIPLDRIPEAIAIGAAFPLLWLLAPSFLRTATARILVGFLVAWRLAAVALLVQDGWCVRFEPSRPYAKDASGAPHAWDMRADWRAKDPSCSAIMTRSYGALKEFPAWFFNLPPDNDSWPGPLDRPPGAVTTMIVHGFVHVSEAGRLRIQQEDKAPTRLIVDGRAATNETTLEPGLHAVEVKTTLTGDRWRFVTTWNDRDIWPLRLATVAKPSRLDTFVRGSVAWIPAAIVVLLLAAWTAAMVREYADPMLLAWTLGASVCLGLLVGFDRADLARHAILGLGLASLVPVRARWRTWRGAIMLVGVPWLTFVVACAAPAVGRFVIYGSSHDNWMFQRFAYRVVMQGYWLEGGSPTFWFQPLYRWIAGLLHVVFGDSSAGEWYWDGACLLAGTVFAWRIANDFAGFRWGIVSAVLALATLTWGTAQYLIGFGLGEISSAGFAYGAALCAMRARSGRWRAAAAAGLFATLAFYTRLNNLPMALGAALFAAPTSRRPAARWREVAIVTGTVGIGVALFAWRTWHYSGVFSVFYGTQRDLLTTWPAGTRASAAIRRMLESVAMVLSVNDPPRFDLYALPVAIGAVVAGLALTRAPRFRQRPMRAVLFFVASIAGALVARGSAYPGRFSVHVIPITCALAVCGVASGRSNEERIGHQQVLQP